MKLEYKAQEFLSPKGKKGWNKRKEYWPVSTIKNYSEAKDFFDSLFINKENFYDIEFVDIGEKNLIRTKFRYGPFNEYPIKFELESSYSKVFDTHVLFGAVLGALSKSSFYFIKIANGEIKIDKMLECY